MKYIHRFNPYISNWEVLENIYGKNYRVIKHYQTEAQCLRFIEWNIYTDILI